jgi:fructose-bisphosphate aldolase class I
MGTASMIDTARALVAPGKGILAADESRPTMATRLATIGLESTEPRRRAYREILLTTEGLGDHIGGVILVDETIRQSDSDGVPFPQVLRAAGVIPGIKVDRGATPLAGFPGEVVTSGLDGLRDRLAEYVALGARFVTWRSVIKIGDGLPTATCVASNAHALARYAALAQEAGLVPIVEPEVLVDGVHDLDRCAEVTGDALWTVYAELSRHRVDLAGTLLKPNMVLPGRDCPDEVRDDEIAEATLDVLRATVPAAVPGIVFLSGGMAAPQATARLDALNRRGPHPWELSFSFGRALQEPVLAAWAGEDANRAAAQAALRHRAGLNGAARYGIYLPEMESATLARSR